MKISVTDQIILAIAEAIVQRREFTALNLSTGASCAHGGGAA